MKLGLVGDALKIALQKVAYSIYNIIIFRNIYSFVLVWIDGFFGFVVTVYLVGKLKSVVYNFYLDVRRRAYFINKQKYPNREHNGIDFEFDAKKLTCQEIDSESEKTLLKSKQNLEADLFNFVFSSALQSSFLSLVVIIAIEYFSTKYELGLVLSIFYCVGLAFVLCFISTFRYMALIANKSNSNGNESKKLKKYVIMYDNVAFVCLVRATVDLALPELSVEFENMSAKYANQIGKVVEFYAKNNCKETDTFVEDENSNKMVVMDRFKFIFPDYYDLNNEFTSAMRTLGYKKDESWAEFRILPLCNLNVNVFTNFQSMNKTK
jgi:hypothetical protein